MTPRDRADALQRQARELLRDTGVVDLFAHLGTVHLVGSYRLDLMYRPDIDLIVTAGELRRDDAITLTKCPASLKRAAEVFAPPRAVALQWP